MNIFLLTITALALAFLFLAEKRNRAGQKKLLAAGYTAFAPTKWSNTRSLLLALGIILLPIGFLLLPLETDTAGQEQPVLFCILDGSLSMLAESSPDRTRLAEAKEYLQDIASALPDWELALLSFAGSAFLDFPPSIDHQGWQEALAAVQPDFGYSPGSVPGEALRLAQDTAASLKIDNAVLLLLSDGEINAENPAAEQSFWTQRRFPCLYILFGKEGEKKPVPGPADWLRTGDGSIAMSVPDSIALAQRLAVVDRPGQMLSAAAGSAQALSIIRRFWGQGDAPWRQETASEQGSAFWASLLLLLAWMFLLVSLPVQWQRKRHLTLLLVGLSAVGWAAEDTSPVALAQRGYALCQQAQNDSTPEKWQAAADCFRQALLLRPGFLPAAYNLEYALQGLAKTAVAPTQKKNIASRDLASPRQLTQSGSAAQSGSSVEQQDIAPMDANARDSRAAETSSSDRSRPGSGTWRALRQRRPRRQTAPSSCPPW